MPNSRCPTQDELNDILGEFFFCLIMFLMGIFFFYFSYPTSLLLTYYNLPFCVLMRFLCVCLLVFTYFLCFLLPLCFSVHLFFLYILFNFLFIFPFSFQMPFLLFVCLFVEEKVKKNENLSLWGGGQYLEGVGEGQPQQSMFYEKNLLSITKG